MRAFSSQCYHDTKYFERCVRERFLRIAQTYDTGLAQASEEGELGIRGQLAYLGIYARPELYELAGNSVIHPIFEDAMERILEYGVTIEQESFLSTK